MTEFAIEVLVLLVVAAGILLWVISEGKEN